MSTGQKPQLKWMQGLLVFFVLTLIAFLIQSHRHAYLVLLDEGFILHGVQRILSGEIIYKDFSVLYPPGTFFFYALLVKLFDLSLPQLIFSERIIKILLLSLVGISFFVLARRYMHGFLAFLGSLLYIVIFGHGHSAPVTADFGITFSTLSVVFLVFYLDSRRMVHIMLSGLLAGLALVSHHLGLIYVFVLTIFLLIVEGGRRIKTVLLFGGPILVLGMIWLVYAYQTSSLSDFFYHMIEFPKEYHTKYVAILRDSSEFIFSPFFYLSNNFKYSPYFILAFSTLYLAFQPRTGRSKKTYKELWLLVTISAVTLLYFVRWHMKGHFEIISVPFNILGLYLISESRKLIRFSKASIFNYFRRVLGLAFITLPLLIFYLGNFDKVGPKNLLQGIKICVAEIATGRDSFSRLYNKYVVNYDELLKNRKGMKDTVTFLKENLSTNEPTFVFPDNPMIYTLADRQSCVRRFYYPSRMLQDKYQNQDIEELMKHEPRYIVFYTFGTYYLSFLEGYDDLINYIKMNYLPVKKYGQYIILEKRPFDKRGHFFIVRKNEKMPVGFGIPPWSEYVKGLKYRRVPKRLIP